MTDGSGNFRFSYCGSNRFDIINYDSYAGRNSKCPLISCYYRCPCNRAGCSVPANEVQATTTTSSSPDTTAWVQPSDPAAAPLYVAKYVVTPAHTTNSFNNTSTTTMNTVNNVTNTEVKTVIKDSFNKDSYNDNSKTVKVTKDSNNTVIAKDNTVNVASNNTTSVNSGNTTTTNTTTNTTNTVTKNSNNTTNVGSNNPVVKNIENHLLSDNVVVVAPAV